MSELEFLEKLKVYDSLRSEKVISSDVDRLIKQSMSPNHTYYQNLVAVLQR